MYSLAYLGDRGLIWEPGTCLLLQQLWMDYTKVMGLHISIFSLRIVKRTESVSQDLGQYKVKHPSGESKSHEETNHKVSNVSHAVSLLSAPIQGLASGVPHTGSNSY